MCFPSSALEIFPTHQTGVYVLIRERNRADSFKIKIKQMSLNGGEIGTFRVGLLCDLRLELVCGFEFLLEEVGDVKSR